MSNPTYPLDPSASDRTGGRFRLTKRKKVALYVFALVAVLAVLEALRNTAATGMSQGAFEENRGPSPAPTDSFPPLPDQPGVVRVGSFNVHMGVPIDAKPVLMRMMSVTASVDILGMQEVPGGGWDGIDNQATLLARSVGSRHWLAAPTRLRWLRPHGGNAVVSSKEPVNAKVLSLPGNTKDFRNLIYFEIDINGTTVACINTHFSNRFPELRKRQFDQAIELFLKADRAILMADMNMTADDPNVTALLAREDVVDAMAAISRRDDQTELKPVTEIDWILLRGLEAIDAGRLPPGISDHPMIWADLRLTPGT